jgi:hypothetical protein
MDSRITYREIIKQTLERYAQFRPSHGDIRLDTIFDDHQGRYSLMQTGWDRGRRVRGNLVYITMQKENIYIEYDGIEHGITDDLIANGIPEDHIVLAYLQPKAA